MGVDNGRNTFTPKGNGKKGEKGKNGKKVQGKILNAGFFETTNCWFLRGHGCRSWRECLHLLRHLGWCLSQYLL